jgi:glycosyltransferase involved in cell wall biosynthesis
LSYAIQVSYPFDSQGQLETAKNIERTLKHADFAMSGIMGFDGIGRWDVLAVNPIVIDTSLWSPSTKKLDSEKIRVLHTPNHRGFKGTEFLINAVDELNQEGVEIELVLVEGMPNSTVRSLLSENIDVLVEQLIAPGYAMSGIEGLASGLVVISNLEDERILRPFLRWSFLGECPIVSGSPESIYSVLKSLYDDPQLRSEIREKSRMYAENRHSFESFAYLFFEIERYLVGDRDSLINFFHPILGDRPSVHLKNIDLHTKFINEDNE